MRFSVHQSKPCTAWSHILAGGTDPEQESQVYLIQRNMLLRKMEQLIKGRAVGSRGKQLF